MTNTSNFFLLGPLKLKIYFYGFFIGLGVLFVYLYSIKKAKKFGLTEKNIDNAFLVSAPLGLLFARIYHVLSSLNYYQSHINEIFKVRNGGLGIFGLILGVFFGLWVSAKFQKISFSSLLSLLFPPILIAQSFGRLGNFVNQEGFGPNHFPTFFLESLLCFISFIIFTIFIPNKLKNNFGFSFYLIAYGLIRFITEFFRIDTWIVGNIHIGHIASIIMIITGIYLLFRQKYISPNLNP